MRDQDDRAARADQRAERPGERLLAARVAAAAVGSSRTTRPVRASARAISTRCCWPPDSRCAVSRARSARPTAARAPSTAARSAADAGRQRDRRATRPDDTTSRTVAGTPPPIGSRCGTYPIRFQSRNRAGASP
ncbi:hypothetical protein BJF79_34490 [Actinomadura sp. CNU-125]|nr:hypothetical protein BJF79_34490 [Actinomadura sp. CNU-125]